MKSMSLRSVAAIALIAVCVVGIRGAGMCMLRVWYAEGFRHGVVDGASTGAVRGWHLDIGKTAFECEYTKGERDGRALVADVVAADTLFRLRQGQGAAIVDAVSRLKASGRIDAKVQEELDCKVVEWMQGAQGGR